MILIEKQQKYQPYLSSCKIDKEEYLTGEKILPSNQKQLIDLLVLLQGNLLKNKLKHLKIKDKNK